MGLPWLNDVYQTWIYHEPFDILGITGDSEIIGYDFAMTAFIIGTFLSIFTTIGIIFEITGIVSFVTQLSQSTEYSEGSGVYFALISVFFIAIGIALPFGINENGKLVRLKPMRRIWNFQFER